MYLSLINPKLGKMYLYNLEDKKLMTNIFSSSFTSTDNGVFTEFVDSFISNQEIISNFDTLSVENSPFEQGHQNGIIIESIFSFYFEDFDKRIDKNYLKELRFNDFALQRFLKMTLFENYDEQKFQLLEKILFEKQEKYQNRLFEYLLICNIENLGFASFFSKETSLKTFNKFLTKIVWIRDFIFTNFDKIVKIAKQYQKVFSKYNIVLNGIANFNDYYKNNQFQIDYVNYDLTLMVEFKAYNKNTLSMANLKQLYQNLYIILHKKGFKEIKNEENTTN